MATRRLFQREVVRPHAVENRPVARMVVESVLLGNEPRVQDEKVVVLDALFHVVEPSVEIALSKVRHGQRKRTDVLVAAGTSLELPDDSIGFLDICFF